MHQVVTHIRIIAGVQVGVIMETILVISFEDGVVTTIVVIAIFQ